MDDRLKKHLIVIAMIYVLLFYVSGVLDRKLVEIYFFSVPAPFLYFTFIYPLSDAVTEVYGPKATWFFLISGYIMTVIFSLLTVGVIHMPNPSGVQYIQVEQDYDLLDSAILKCLGFGYLAFFVGMYINVKLLAKYKLKFNGRYYYLRSIFASCVSEFVVTVLANILIWGNRIPHGQLAALIGFGYLFLIPTTALWAILGKFVKDFLYIAEGNKAYVYNTSFWQALRNPSK